MARTSATSAAKPERTSGLRREPAALRALRSLVLALVAIVGLGVALPAFGAPRAEVDRHAARACLQRAGSPSRQWRERPARPTGYLDTTEAELDNDDLEREERIAPELGGHRALGSRTVPIPRDDARVARSAVQRDPSHFAVATTFPRGPPAA